MRYTLLHCSVHYVVSYYVRFACLKQAFFSSGSTWSDLNVPACCESGDDCRENICAVLEQSCVARRQAVMSCTALRSTASEPHRWQPLKLSPRDQSGLELGVEAKILASASASKIWPRPRPQTFGLGLASISLSYYVIRHFFRAKIVYNSGILLTFPVIILNKSYVVNHYVVLFS